MCPEGILAHFPNDLISLRRKGGKISCARAREFVFFSLSAAACFVPVRKPWTVLLHPWQAAVVRFAWSCTYKVH